MIRVTTTTREFTARGERQTTIERLREKLSTDFVSFEEVHRVSYNDGSVSTREEITYIQRQYIVEIT